MCQTTGNTYLGKKIMLQQTVLFLIYHWTRVWCLRDDRWTYFIVCWQKMATVRYCLHEPIIAYIQLRSKLFQHAYTASFFNWLYYTRYFLFRFMLIRWVMILSQWHVIVLKTMRQLCLLHTQHSQNLQITWFLPQRINKYRHLE